MIDKSKLKHYTRRRFDQLVATQAEIRSQWWSERLTNSNVGKPNHYQRKRERVMNLIELKLNDMCFFGLYDDSYSAREPATLIELEHTVREISGAFKRMSRRYSEAIAYMRKREEGR